ncbi:MAG: NAD(P)/FAD-dependent oxidoreductase, partial [Vulcanimicrobiota bacterium]
MKNFDIVITGAGPAGLMAAAVAAGADKKTALIEKNSRPGKKLLLTGGGRCNLANYTTNFHELVEQYGEKGKFLYSGFDSFGLFHTLDFFHQQGLSTITDE